MKTQQLFFTTLAAALLLLSACKKDETYNANAQLSLAMTVGNEALQYDKVYTIGGKAVKFSLVQFYLSNMTAKDDEGNSNSFGSAVVLAKPNMAATSIGKVTLDHTHEFFYTFGIDSITNHGDPALYASTHPLAVGNDMHWTWNSGYIFLKIEGKVDTDGDGTPEQDMFYHIGMDAMRRSNNLMMHFDTPEGDGATLNYCLSADVAKFFTGVDMSTDYATHTMDNMPLAKKIADNVASVFSKGSCQ